MEEEGSHATRRSGPLRSHWLPSLTLWGWLIQPMSKLAENHSEMDFYFHGTGANQKLRWVPFGSPDKGHCRFPFKVKKKQEKLKILFDFDLSSPVMHQEEAA